jgi:hypothetical protein
VGESCVASCCVGCRAAERQRLQRVKSEGGFDRRVAQRANREHRRKPTARLFVHHRSALRSTSNVHHRSAFRSTSNLNIVLSLRSLYYPIVIVKFGMHN